MSNFILQIRHQLQGVSKSLFETDESGSLYKRFAKGAVGTFGLKIGSLILSFLTSLLLAQLLNETDRIFL